MSNNNSSNNSSEESYDEEYSASEEAEEEEENFPQTEQTLEYQQSLLIPDVYQHPILSFKEDSLLGPLGDLVKSLLVPFPPTMQVQRGADLLKGFLFNSILGKKQISQLKKEFQELGLESKTTCGNMISLEEISFRCLDCEMISNGAAISSLICSKCFDKSNHDGHRVVVVKLVENCTGYCDCGDSDVLKTEGFCPDHKRVEINRVTELKKFPEVLMKNCQEALCKAFYSLTAILEIAEKLGKGNSYQTLVSLGQKFSDEILDFIENGYTEISNSFLLVLNSVLESRLQACCNLVWHDCDCLKPEANNSGPKTSHPCKCSILSILLRYCVFIEKGGQPKIKKVLTECMKEVQFRNFVGLEMTKYVQFLFPLAYLTDHAYIRRNSILPTVNLLISSNEDLVGKMIRSEYFKNYLEIMKNTINNYPEASSRMINAAHLFEDLAIWFVNPNFKVSTKIFISETTFVTDILDVLATIQTKHIYPGETGMKLFDHEINYEMMDYILRILKEVVTWIENVLKLVSSWAKEEKKKFFKVFVKEWYNRYQKIRAAESGLCLALGFERILCCALRSHEYKITQENLIGFFAEYLPGVKAEKLAESVIANLLKNFGFMRFIGGVLDTDMGKLFNGYYLFGWLFYEADVVLTQMMIMIANPKGIFEVVGDNFFAFDEDLKGTWKDLVINSKDEYLKQKTVVLQDFLSFLVYLMSDELCLLNLNAKTASPEEIENDPNTLRIVEKATLNVLLSEYWTEYGFLKENMANSILFDESGISRVIPKISVHNEKDQKIRIKDELETDLDPYIFYKTPLLQADIINHAASRIEKNPNIDVVGGKSYTDLQEHLGVIKEKLFQSNLPKFLNQLIISSSNKAELIPLVPKALKLILLRLQNQSHTEKNYLKAPSGFSLKLAELQKREDLKECKLCLQKIQDILGRGETQEAKTALVKVKGPKSCIQIFQSIFKPSKKGSTPSTPATPQVDDAEMKKKLAQEKMKKMKEEFAKKQALFANKNKIEEGSPGVKKERDLTCPYCLTQIDEEKSTYGLPIFITYTNNYSIPSFNDVWVVEDISSLASMEWMPVISSCHHYYHKKCFGEAFTNMRMSEEAEHTKNPVEGCCSLCKTLCNHFLVINESKEPENSDKPLPAIFSFELTEKMLKLITVQTSKLDDPLKFDVIVKRAFKYFIETFYLHEKSHELEKAYGLYLNFFKSLKREGVNFGEFENGPLQDLLKEPVTEHMQLYHLSPGVPPHSLLKMTPEYTTNEKFARIMLESVTGKQQDLSKIQLKTLSDYVEMRMCYHFILTQRNGKSLKVKECASYYRNNMSIFRDLILDTLVLPVRRFIVAIHFNKCLLSETSPKNLHAICNLLCDYPMKHTSEFLDNLFNVMEIPCTVESLLNECLGKIEKSTETITLPNDKWPEARVKAFEEVLRKKPETLKPRFFKFPETFA